MPRVGKNNCFDVAGTVLFLSQLIVAEQYPGFYGKASATNAVRDYPVN
ncbi:MAG: hypothetical protein ACP5NQ_03200 [Vulcanisaeta sp.]